MTDGASPEEPFVVPIGESDQDSPAEPQADEPSEQSLSQGEQRQHASAAAAYGKAAHSVRKPGHQPAAQPAEASAATETNTAATAAGPAGPATTETGPEAAESDVDGGRQVEQDLNELAAKAELADEYLMLAQRTQADFENYRKRAVRDAALAQERGIAKLAKELLPAIDNLDRALQASTTDAESAEGGSQILDGIKLVHADLLSALGRAGIEPFSPEGEQFDPTLHEAVAHAPIDGAESGTVVEVYQQGYKLGETVLRPARVLVAA